jgi:hypothetical protein
MTDQRKRKRQTISLADKQVITEASNTIPKTADLVKHFKNKDTILKKKDKLLKTIDHQSCKARGSIADVRSENVSVDSLLLKACFDFMQFIGF